MNRRWYNVGISNDMNDNQLDALRRDVGGRGGLESLDKHLGRMPGYRDMTAYSDGVITYRTSEGIERRFPLGDIGRQLKEKTTANY